MVVLSESAWGRAVNEYFAHFLPFPAVVLLES